MVNVPPKVVLTDYTFPSIETERSLIEAAGAKFKAYQCQNREDISSAVDGANVVLVQLANIDQDAVSKLAPGATIVRYGIGYDNIDVEAARKFGIKVAYVPDYCTDEVADHTVALMLSLVRGLYVMNATVRSGGWMNEILKLTFSPLNEMTIGFIGLGRIARAVVDRTRAFNFRHLAYDPLVSASNAERVGVELDDLHSVISQSDILSLHVPLSQETFHLINAESLRWMKPSAVLVNTARGGLVDLEALSDALCNAQDRGCCTRRLRGRAVALESSLARRSQGNSDAPRRLVFHRVDCSIAEVSGRRGCQGRERSGAALPHSGNVKIEVAPPLLTAWRQSQGVFRLKFRPPSAVCGLSAL